MTTKTSPTTNSISRWLLWRGVLLIPLVIAAKRKVEHDRVVGLFKWKPMTNQKKKPTDTKRQPSKSSLSIRTRSKFRSSALVLTLVSVPALCLPVRVVLAAEPLTNSALRQIQAVEHPDAE